MEGGRKERNVLKGRESKNIVGDRGYMEKMQRKKRPRRGNQRWRQRKGAS